MHVCISNLWTVTVTTEAKPHYFTITRFYLFGRGRRIPKSWFSATSDPQHFIHSQNKHKTKSCWCQYVWTWLISCRVVNMEGCCIMSGSQWGGDGGGRRLAADRIRPGCEQWYQLTHHRYCFKDFLSEWPPRQSHRIPLPSMLRCAWWKAWVPLAPLLPLFRLSVHLYIRPEILVRKLIAVQKVDKGTGQGNLFVLVMSSWSQTMHSKR